MRSFVPLVDAQALSKASGDVRFGCTGGIHGWILRYECIPTVDLGIVPWLHLRHESFSGGTSGNKVGPYDATFKPWNPPVPTWVYTFHGNNLGSYSRHNPCQAWGQISWNLEMALQGHQSRATWAALGGLVSIPRSSLPRLEAWRSLVRHSRALLPSSGFRLPGLPFIDLGIGSTGVPEVSGKVRVSMISKNPWIHWEP